jgi:cellulose synthase/poly-beta-1,6-N-acetylglucosamine synthase-like glycosyltransferase
VSLLADISVWVLSILAIPLALVVGVFALQVVAAAWPRGDARVVLTPTHARRRIAVLVPAHDEAAGILHTLESVLPQLHEGDRVLVVADNCTDDTAAIARQAGAVVVERFHATERGKGFALAHGVDALRADSPGLVVILDADCVLAPGALAALTECVMTWRRPAQALYLMLAPPQASLPRRLAQFAWRVRNWVRPAGWHRLGLPCQLMGTGMAFTWAMLRDAPLANASIVEDMKLGIDLGMRGQAPMLCAEALVTSMFPEAAAATQSQRTRWEHGHLEMILREVPAMLAKALQERDGRLAGMALDLCVPPLALLAAALLAGLALAIGVGVWTETVAIVAVYGVLLASFAAAALIAWKIRGSDLVRLLELASIPFYIARKIPLYLRFVVRRQKQWVRTDRDEP